MDTVTHLDECLLPYLSHGLTKRQAMIALAQAFGSCDFRTELLARAETLPIEKLKTGPKPGYRKPVPPDVQAAIRSYYQGMTWAHIERRFGVKHGRMDYYIMREKLERRNPHS